MNMQNRIWIACKKNETKTKNITISKKDLTNDCPNMQTVQKKWKPCSFIPLDFKQQKSPNLWAKEYLHILCLIDMQVFWFEQRDNLGKVKIRKAFNNDDMSFIVCAKDSWAKKNAERWFMSEDFKKSLTNWWIAITCAIAQMSSSDTNIFGGTKLGSPTPLSSCARAYIVSHLSHAIPFSGNVHPSSSPERWVTNFPDLRNVPWSKESVQEMAKKKRLT